MGQARGKVSFFSVVSVLFCSSLLMPFVFPYFWLRNCCFICFFANVYICRTSDRSRNYLSTVHEQDVCGKTYTEKEVSYDEKDVWYIAKGR